MALKVKIPMWLIWALSGLLAVLLVVAALIPRGGAPEETAPEPTETTEATLPPPEANPYGPLDFQYDGKYLSCLAGESVTGIDVSAHQQTVDWEKVAAAGVKFAMIRVGYRGYETGNLVEDPYAQDNYAGAKKAGLQVGAYLFSQAISVEEALEEADFLLEKTENWELDLPVVYDWEYISKEARTGSADARLVTDCTKAFCDRVAAAGRQPMVYFNRHQAQDLLFLEELTQYPFWLAMYTDRMTYPYKVDMWQYTCEGSVPGIDGNVDINVKFVYE